MKSGFAPRLRELVVTLAGSEAVALQRSPRDGLELSLKVMSLISVADGVVDEAEIELVQQSAGTIAAATVEQAFRIVSADQESVWQELRGAHDLDERVRREIFDAACDVAASDGALHADEVALIRRLGSVLGLAGRYIEERIVGR
jgi:tellurite resistance protein